MTILTNEEQEDLELLAKKAIIRAIYGPTVSSITRDLIKNLLEEIQKLSELHKVDKEVVLEAFCMTVELISTKTKIIKTDAKD